MREASRRLPGVMAATVAVGRLALGGVALARPDLVARPWVGRPRDTHPVTVLGRALGGRDLALGIGALVAVTRGRPVEAVAWVAAGAAADAVDAAATAATWSALPRGGRARVLVLAGGSALVGAGCAALLGAGDAS